MRDCASYADWHDRGGAHGNSFLGASHPAATEVRRVRSRGDEADGCRSRRSAAAERAGARGVLRIARGRAFAAAKRFAASHPRIRDEWRQSTRQTYGSLEDGVRRRPCTPRAPARRGFGSRATSPYASRSAANPAWKGDPLHRARAPARVLTRRPGGRALPLVPAPTALREPACAVSRRCLRVSPDRAPRTPSSADPRAPARLQRGGRAPARARPRPA